MIFVVATAIVGLAVGIPAYTGLWRSWTGPDGDRAWGLGALWAGVGACLFTLSQVLPPDGAPSTILLFVGAALLVFGVCSCWWMLPPLRPRWYRAQYAPLLRGRRP